MSTLWTKGVEATGRVEEFTVGNDRELDLRLARYDVRGSMAHIRMLAAVGLLKEEEERILSEGLSDILSEIAEGRFSLSEDVEDIHSQVELMLTDRFGELGKKIHSGRSRNDQVLVDIKLYLKDEIRRIDSEVSALFDLLQSLSEKYKDVLLPGYTHAQIAMPSSFGLWLGAYAETFIDDLYMLDAAYRIADQNPLGSAAGYGSSFPLDRQMTTDLLGFGSLHYNSIAAQLSRGKCERALACAMSQIALTLNKLAADCCMYMCGNFAFITFPENLCTGSSIMPHKKNPDVWEIIRGKCNRIQSLPNEISLMLTNMPHGYHRDYQLLKDVLFPALDSLHGCLSMAGYMLEHLQVREGILQEEKYRCIFTVEEVNRLTAGGMPFRDAYRKVGQEVKSGEFRFGGTLHHTHLGSIGNLSNDLIRKKRWKD